LRPTTRNLKQGQAHSAPDPAFTAVPRNTLSGFAMLNNR
jgi:hypothetical protein